MRRLFKHWIKKRCSFEGHEKLEEDLYASPDPVVEGVTFYVKYLGSCLVDKPSGEDTTAEAVKTIVTMAKKMDRKLHRVALTISLVGIKMVNCVTSDLNLDFSIYRISYCSADATYDHVFTFIATNRNNTMECHAYLCPKRKMAQSATLTIAQAFNLAYECWKSSKERKTRKKKKMKVRNSEQCTCESNKQRTMKSSSNRVENIDKNSCEDKLFDTSPSSGYNSSLTGSQETDCDGQEGEERLLIDLNSPCVEGKTMIDCWKGVTIVDTDTNNHDLLHEDQNDCMDISFTQIALRNSPQPILRRLPPNAASLQIGSFLNSDSLSSTPTASPLHGSCLTTSQLCTPIGSPASKDCLGPRQARRQWIMQTSPLVISSNQGQIDTQADSDRAIGDLKSF